MNNIDWQDYALGEHRVACPECGGNRRVKNAGLKVESGGAVLHCFKCGVVQTFREERHAVRRPPRIMPERLPSEPKRTTLSDWGRALWDKQHLRHIRHR